MSTAWCTRCGARSCSCGARKLHVLAPSRTAAGAVEELPAMLGEVKGYVLPGGPIDGPAVARLRRRGRVHEGERLAGVVELRRTRSLGVLWWALLAGGLLCLALLVLGGAG